jgi:hypothetical protein
MWCVDLELFIPDRTRVGLELDPHPSLPRRVVVQVVEVRRLVAPLLLEWKLGNDAFVMATTELDVEDLRQEGAQESVDRALQLVLAYRRALIEDP